MRLFSCISVVLIVVLNKWPETNGQNAILNTFEEYYKCAEKRMLENFFYFGTFGFYHQGPSCSKHR